MERGVRVRTRKGPFDTHTRRKMAPKRSGGEGKGGGEGGGGREDAALC